MTKVVVVVGHSNGLDISSYQAQFYEKGPSICGRSSINILDLWVPGRHIGTLVSTHSGHVPTPSRNSTRVTDGRSVWF